MLYFRVNINLDQIPSRQEFLRLKILDQMGERSQKSTRILKKSELEILQGTRHGRFYPFRGWYYQASAPYEAPAKRSGAYRASFFEQNLRQGDSFTMRIESGLTVGRGYILGQLLEKGTKRMATRPHRERIQNEAWPEIRKVFERPYL